MSQARQVIVIGAGAAGLMAAGTAAKEGAEVTILEKNDRPGKKLLITGKGRCNITNDADIESVIRSFPDTGKFLYSAIYTFSNWQVVDFFEKYGVPTQVERGGRVFPASGLAKDVVEALARYTRDFGVHCSYHQDVEGMDLEDGQVVGVRVRGKGLIPAERVILATGGSSYPGTGSTGDGYRIAESLGHTIKPLIPSLVPLVTKESWVTEMQGLSLRNVTLTLTQNGNKIGEEFGEMMFTHFGITGPIVLTLSRDTVPLLKKGPVTASVDLKPALDSMKLDQRLQRDFEAYINKDFKNALDDLLPKSMIPIIIRLSGIPEEKKVNQITAEERKTLGHLIKHLTFTVIGHRGFKEAIVTRGGVHTKEIDPSTMQSKKVAGLYFAGEVIDLDAYTGGFNLQAAFSTGYLAGLSAAQG